VGASIFVWVKCNLNIHSLCQQTKKIRFEVRSMIFLAFSSSPHSLAFEFLYRSRRTLRNQVHGMFYILAVFERRMPTALQQPNFVLLTRVTGHGSFEIVKKASLDSASNLSGTWT